MTLRSQADTSQWFRPARFAVLAIGIAYLVLSRVTTPSLEGDAFDSSVWKWGFVVLPLVAAIGTGLRFERSPAVWSVGLVLPCAVYAFVAGVFLHDPDHGASFWIVGEIFLVVLAAFVAAGCVLGDAIGVSLARRCLPRCPSCAAVIADTDRFCRECGSEIVEESG